MPGFNARVLHTVVPKISLYLAPDAAGLGAGRALLGEVIAQSAAAGCRVLVAIIGDHGIDRTAPHARVPGCRNAARVRLKFGRWLDIVIMQHTITD